MVLLNIMHFMDFTNNSVLVCTLGGAVKNKLRRGGQENVMMGFLGCCVCVGGGGGGLERQVNAHLWYACHGLQSDAVLSS